MRRGRLWILLSVASRVAVLLVILVGALWPTYLNLKTAYNNARIAELSHGTAWGTFYRAMDGLDVLSGGEDILPGLFAGAPPAMTLFGATFIDPVVGLSTLIGSPDAWSALLPGLIAVLIMMVVTGRGYCSFGCPASLLFTFNLRLRERIEAVIPRLEELRRELPEWVRYGVLLGGSISAVFFGGWVWQLILPYLMISATLVNLVIGVPVGIASGVISFILLSDFLLMPGEFCRSVCPLGLLLGRTSRFAMVKMAADARPCPDDCDRCRAACDLLLDPHLGATIDCSLCGRCVTSCPSQKLSIRVGRPFARSGKVVMAMFIFAVSMLHTGDVFAHHYRGLPHYGYFDNYPQVPTEEYIAGEGRFEINFTLYNFQGMQRVDVTQPDDLQIFLVIFDLKRKTTFGGVATIEIRAENTVVARFEQPAEQESIYFIHTQAPASDDLVMDVSFVDPEGERIVISSPFQLPGDGGHNPLTWVGGALLALVGVIVLVSKQARPSRKRRYVK